MRKKLLLSTAIQQLCCCNDPEAEKMRRILEEEYGILFASVPEKCEIPEVVINPISQDNCLINSPYSRFVKPFAPKVMGKPVTRKVQGKFFSRKAKR